jgi:hypothetical protein
MYALCNDQIPPGDSTATAATTDATTAATTDATTAATTDATTAATTAATTDATTDATTAATTDAMLSAELAASGIADHFHLTADTNTSASANTSADASADASTAADQWPRLCRLSFACAALRGAVVGRAGALTDPLNWAAPVQMKTAYGLIRSSVGGSPGGRGAGQGQGQGQGGTGINAGAFVSLLRFAVGERAQAQRLSKSVGSLELLAYDTLLKSICYIIPVVDSSKRDKYTACSNSSGSSSNSSSSSSSLVDNDELFADIESMLSVLSPAGSATATATTASTSSSTSGQSTDALRLAEEIHLEDMVYSAGQSQRAARMKERGLHRGDIYGTEDAAGGTPARLQFIKSDMFSDFCSSSS